MFKIIEIKLLLLKLSKHYIPVFLKSNFNQFQSLFQSDLFHRFRDNYSLRTSCNIRQRHLQHIQTIMINSNWIRQCVYLQFFSLLGLFCYKMGIEPNWKTCCSTIIRRQPVKIASKYGLLRLRDTENTRVFAHIRVRLGSGVEVLASLERVPQLPVFLALILRQILHSLWGRHGFLLHVLFLSKIIRLC